MARQRKNQNPKPSQKLSRKRKDKAQSRAPVTAFIAWAAFPSSETRGRQSDGGID
jgi:hypothetical protein